MWTPPDDMQDWRIQKSHEAEPYPCRYPALLPCLSRRRTAMRTLQILQNTLCAAWFLSLFSCAFFLKLEHPPALLTLLVLGLPIPLLICLVLRFLPELFWHCPVCKQPFPYYIPGRGLPRDRIRHKDCLEEILNQHIPYDKPKFCPLIVPSECPQCHKKFYCPPEQNTAHQHKDHF